MLGLFCECVSNSGHHLCEYSLWVKTDFFYFRLNNFAQIIKEFNMRKKKDMLDMYVIKILCHNLKVAIHT